MPPPQVPPSIKETTFCCPYCSAYTTQFWASAHAKSREDKDGAPGVWSQEDVQAIRDETATTRDHELSARARTFLERQRAFTQLKGDSVFLDPVTGREYNDDKPPRERYWRPVLTALGLRYREPYQMRHTYATMVIMAGASPIYVARQMGNSPRIVFKHYARWIESADRGRERGKIDTFLAEIWNKSKSNAR